MTNETAREQEIKDAVRQRYGSIGRRFAEEPAPGTGPENPTGEPGRSSCCGPTPRQSAGCCGSDPAVDGRQDASCCGSGQATDARQDASCCGSSQAAELATGAARFYSSDEISGLPDTVTDASLGCGNPIAIAGLQPGEVVLDLGSGGGIDCFLAAKQVGPAGRVIGLDMTPDMIMLARRNAKNVGVKNVDFRYGEMEDIPLPDGSVDAIISNCVINLSTDKDAVFQEAYRVLRPGGRMSVSDMVVDGDLPQDIRDSLDAWACCIAGALDESVYLEKMRAAGFERIEVVSRDYAATDQAVEAEDLVHKVASIKVVAYKPS